MSSPELVAEALTERILSLELTPGTPLREIALAETYACSRRTAREALLQLARAGLVSHERNRGAVVRTFTPEDISDLYRVRRTLEGQGAASCIAAPLAQLQTVDQAYERLAASARSGQDTVEHALMDLRFHAAVIALIGSTRIDSFFEQIAVEMAYAIRLIQHDEVAERVSEAEVLRDHARIRDAVLARNPLEAQRAVLAHIEENEPRLLRVIRAG
ncbi:DNA-binding GntR family transcriptional regulator [Leucobacter luti]|uniref:GntR family transcriptional regulator n=1 Tax=Leucobacter luti TaxID=340320 RepID=UPI0010462ADB|nr:GntR family transcriptional regulator [Leucobacter luti]MCW2288547.1 DNA-binding GntR family transcriptional regulator [Leucobacter luti]TCK45297.1 DNA-binding GntR family transcriptional regulator [Leucobacter luti]